MAPVPQKNWFCTNQTQQTVIKTLEAATECLKQGGLILYPTDTIWGIGCDAFNQQAIENIYKLKDRSAGKNLIVLLDEGRNLLKYLPNPNPDILQIINSFHRPTTVIYKDVIGFPDSLLAADGSLGIRIVRDEFCKRLIKKFGDPIVSTSANLSGEPSPGNFSEISAAIKSGVNYIADHRQQETGSAVSSRIVRIKSDGTLEVIRE